MKIKDFLRIVCRNGPYHISYGKSPTSHEQFDTVDDALACVENAQRNELNTWFRLNTIPVGSGDDSSCKDSDVTFLTGIPLDIDPPAGLDSANDLSSWQQNCIAMLDQGSIVPVPTLVYTSGNGIQALYLFTEPLPISEAAKYSFSVKNIAAKLNAVGWTADRKISNPSRLMRVPCGRNFKRKVSGEFPAAFIVKHTPVTFTIDDPAFNAADVAVAGVSTDMVKVNDDILPPMLLANDLLRRLIVQGTIGLDANEYGGKYDHLISKFADESNGITYIACHLLTAGNEDDMVRQALMTPGTWTEKNLYNKDNPAREITRKLEPETMQTYYPDLQQIRDWNRRFKYILGDGGQAMVVEVRPDHSIACRLIGHFKEAYSFEVKEQFEFRPTNPKDPNSPKSYVRVEPKKPESMVAAWIQHDDTPRYLRLQRTMSAVQPMEFNSWPGWAVQPRPGNWDLLRNHIRDNLCRNDTAKFEYMMKWLAWGVQHSGPMHSAVVLYGIQGAGKNVFSKCYGGLWKANCPEILHESQVSEQFNTELARTNVIVFNEAFFSGNVKQSNFIKGLITAPTLTINGKYVNTYFIENSLRIIIASNEELPVRIEPSDRRFFVMRTADRLMSQSEALAIYKQYEEGGQAAMLHDLLIMDLGGFTPACPPKTAEHKELMMLTDISRLERSPIEGYIHEWLNDGIIPGAGLHQGDDWVKVKSSVLLQWLRERRHCHITGKMLVAKLRKLCGVSIGHTRSGNILIFPPLKSVRAEFEKHVPSSADDWKDDAEACWHIPEDSFGEWEDKD